MWEGVRESLLPGLRVKEAEWPPGGPRGPQWPTALVVGIPTPPGGRVKKKKTTNKLIHQNICVTLDL